jgi:hypothetical protein
VSGRKIRRKVNLLENQRVSNKKTKKDKKEMRTSEETGWKPDSKQIVNVKYKRRLAKRRAYEGN